MGFWVRILILFQLVWSLDIKHVTNTTIDTTGKLHKSTFTENYASIDGLVKLHVLFRHEPRDRIIK